jgi:trans-2,3-dihydro-3-hydroxyanthranilate isomerase
VFLLEPEGEGDARARIFTPYTELPFAGHPVLGTAFVVGERRGRDVVAVETGAGLVPVTLKRESERIVYGEMHQPIPRWEAFTQADTLLRVLGVQSAALPIEVYDNGPCHVMVALASEDEVAALTPDMRALAGLGEVGVSCFAIDGARVKTRMFGPGLGVAEDPATGSAAGPLAVHLARHGVVAFGTELQIAQGEEIGRPSQLRATAEGGPEQITVVRVGGGAVVVAEGRYRLD